MKVRGVNIHAVSQIEACRLPEYGVAQNLDAAQSIAACYIGIIPGAQLWYEYSMDEPHPSNAMYLLKLFMNGEHVVTWVNPLGSLGFDTF